MATYPRVSSLKIPADFRRRQDELGISLPFDEVVESGPQSPLGQPFTRLNGTRIGNRFAILPMEGWDGTTDGKPTELTLRRWRNFGASGAKLIWGGEAFAVRHDGRANPNQLVMNEANIRDIARLRDELVAVHASRFGTTDDLLVGVQLTHSGRFARPNDKKRTEPRIAYRHPILDAKFNVIDDKPLLSDDDLERLRDDFLEAAKLAVRAGFAFADIKHCHGYLGHELLSAFDRPGKYGGSFENRTRFLREIVAGVRSVAPELDLGVRLSIFDFVPFCPGRDGVGEPAAGSPYHYAFGGDGSGTGIDLSETHAFLDLLESLGIDLLCTTAGSPYYNPHMQRPATFPPSDGYQPPEDPLVGVARQLDATAALKAKRPQMTVVGAAYSYLQDWLPHVGQRVVRDGGADFIGLGRMVLSYWDLPADVVEGKALARKRICRTFSDCTTAPRNGIISGCYPLDPFYKSLPEAQELAAVKKGK